MGTGNKRHFTFPAFEGINIVSPAAFARMLMESLMFFEPGYVSGRHPAFGTASALRAECSAPGKAAPAYKRSPVRLTPI